MIKVIELDSGVKLILDKMDSVKSVSLGIWCNTGSASENEEEFGISHFIEHMLFKGTPSRNAYQIVKEMDSLGADINAFTSKERTCFYAKCVDEYLFQVADVLCDMIENPLFDSDELEREKQVVIEEINMNADDPDDVALETFDNIVLEGSSLAHPVLGYKQNVNSFNHDMLDKYYSEHYTRDNIAVSIAGSFKEDEVISYFNKRFNNLKLKSKTRIYGELSNNKQSVTIYKDIEQAHIVLGLKHVSVTDKNKPLLTVLSTIMGGGMSSRLFQNVREKKGLAYSVYSSNSFYGITGEFGIIAGVAKDRVEEALDAIKEELDKLKTESISLEEFNTAKQQLKSAYIFSQESTQSRMRTNGMNYFSLGHCPDQIEKVSEIDSITLEQVDACKKYISNYDNYTIVNVTGK